MPNRRPASSTEIVSRWSAFLGACWIRGSSSEALGWWSSISIVHSHGPRQRQSSARSQVTQAIESVVSLGGGCGLQDVTEPGGGRWATARAARGPVVGELGHFLTGVVDDFGDPGGHRGGEHRAGMGVLPWSSAAVRPASVGGCCSMPVQPQVQPPT